MIIPV